VSEVVSIDDLLRHMRQEAVMRKAIDPRAPDPDVWMRPIAEMVRRYPPIQKDDGYDFAPLINGAALEYGLDPQVVGQMFRDAAAAVQTERVAAVKAAEDLLRGDV
jgi:hypothetical protein